jgi:hypothetical protein
MVNAELTMKTADFCRFRELSALSLCQVALFHFREKSRLKADPDNLKQVFPGANSRRGQERKETVDGRLDSRDRISLSLAGGF